MLLIECDLRLPTVAVKLGIKGQPGLTDLLTGETTLGAAIRKLSKYGIHVLPGRQYSAGTNGLVGITADADID